MPTHFAEVPTSTPGDQFYTPRPTLISLANRSSVGVLVATAVAVVAVAVVVVTAVSSGTKCRGSYCCGTDRRSAIRIPATIGDPTTIGRSAICSTAIGTTAVGHATARNPDSTASVTCRADPSASTGAATAVSERVIGNKGHAHKEGGRETYDSFAQHWCSPSLTITDGEQRGVATNEADYAPQ